MPLLGWSGTLTHLVVDVQTAIAAGCTPEGELAWLSDEGARELYGFIEHYLAREVDHLMRFLVEERVRDGWEPTARKLLTLREPTPANVKAYVHDRCRGEKFNELKRLINRNRYFPGANEADPADYTASRRADEPATRAELSAMAARLLAALTRASEEIPARYNAWLLMDEGLKPKFIAEQLGLTTRSVRNYVADVRAMAVLELVKANYEREDIQESLRLGPAEFDRLLGRGQKFQPPGSNERSGRDG